MEDHRVSGDDDDNRLRNPHWEFDRVERPSSDVSNRVFKPTLPNLTTIVIIISAFPVVILWDWTFI